MPADSQKPTGRIHTTRGRKCLPAGRLDPRHRTIDMTGRSSDLRLVTMLGRPSHNYRCSGNMPEPLAEYSSGPVPDSHRLPFSSPAPAYAVRKNLSVWLCCSGNPRACQFSTPSLSLAIASAIPSCGQDIDEGHGRSLGFRWGECYFNNSKLSKKPFSSSGVVRVAVREAIATAKNPASVNTYRAASRFEVSW